MAALNSSRGGGERQHQGQREHQRNQLLHGVIRFCESAFALLCYLIQLYFTI